MPKVPEDMFLTSIIESVLANREFIPPYLSENWAWETRDPKCLYVRPLIMGHGPQIAVRPAMDHTYLVYTTPVRALYPVEGIRVLVSNYFHRAAPGGIGSSKASANYIGGFLATQSAKHGQNWVDGKSQKTDNPQFTDVLYLDAANNKYIEEFSGANFFAVSKDGALICPESDSILPGVTRDSVLILAEELGVKIERRPLNISEVMAENYITEAFCTGNAAVLTPIVSMHYDGASRTFKSGTDGLAKRIWDILVGIQLQTQQDPFGWVIEIG